MRTFLSHDATAKCSDIGEKERSEMLSSGGLESWTSFVISPVVLPAAADPVVGFEEKRPDMVTYAK